MDDRVVRSSEADAVTLGHLVVSVGSLAQSCPLICCVSGSGRCVSCSNPSETSESPPSETPDCTCNSDGRCAVGLESAVLREVPGALSASLAHSLDNKDRLSVVTSDMSASITLVRQAIARTGCTVAEVLIEHRVIVLVDQLACPKSSVRKLEGALMCVDGVREVTVSFERRMVVVDGTMTVDAVLAVILDEGLRSLPFSIPSPDDGTERTLILPLGASITASVVHMQHLRRELHVLDGVRSVLLAPDHQLIVRGTMDEAAVQQVIAHVVLDNNEISEEVSVACARPVTIRQLEVDGIAAASPVFYVRIDGMRCAHGCARVIEQALQELSGVSLAKVVFDEQMATVTGEVDADAILGCVRGLGFQPSLLAENPASTTATGTLLVSAPVHIVRVVGLRCRSNCVAQLELALTRVDGVASAVVDFSDKTAVVTGTASLDSIHRAIRECGFSLADDQVSPTETLTEASPSVAESDTPHEYAWIVAGLRCANVCCVLLREHLLSHPAVIAAVVEFPMRRVTVKAHCAAPEIERHVAQKGFVLFNSIPFHATVRDATALLSCVVLEVVGLSVTNVGRVHDALSTIIGVSGVHVLPAAASYFVFVGFDQRFCHPEALARVVSTTHPLARVASIESVEIDRPTETLNPLSGVSVGASAEEENSPSTTESIELPTQPDAVALPSSTSPPSVTIVDIPADLDDGKWVLQVTGMSCASCVGSVSRALQAVPGVSSVDVNLVTQKATVSGSSHALTVESLVAALDGAGYSGQAIETPAPAVDRPTAHVLQISGMSCASCTTAVARALEAVPGVASVSVNIATSRAKVLLVAPGATSVEDLIQAVDRAGYHARPLHAIGEAATVSRDATRQMLLREEELSMWRRLFWWSALFTIPLMFIVLILQRVTSIMHGFLTELAPGLTVDNFVQFLLTTPVHFVCGWHFHRSALRTVLRCRANMDVLISLGTNAAYWYSLYVMIIMMVYPSYMEPVFFDTSAALIMFLCLGKYLETYAKGRTSSAILKLMDLGASTATVVALDEHGQVTNETELSVDDVYPGDIVRITPGGKVPVDGVVVAGSSAVNEAMMTGESVPVVKTVGAKVIGGTVNGDGVLFVCCGRVGSESTLSQIVRLVEDAQSSQAPIQRIADTISAVFVPIVCLIALVTLFAWLGAGLSNGYPTDWRPDDVGVFPFALLFTIAVLVIACPCALGLATPTAIMVGTGVGASMGVLIKGGEPLQAFRNTTAILFDKTGTLTAGKFSIVRVQSFVPSMDEAQLLSITASAESVSEHPIAKAIVEDAKLRGLPVATPLTFVAVPGRGITATLPAPTGSSSGSSLTVTVGSPTYFDSMAVDLSSETRSAIADSEERGMTVIVVSVDGVVVGLVALADTPRPESQDTIAALEASGIQCYMVTGDQPRAAHAIAKRVGINPARVFAAVLPAGKLDRVREVQQAGHVVAFVGDGVNDAPALTQADVGVAVGCGADVALESADIVLVRSDLRDVQVAQNLARTIFRRIIINYIWALGYNILAIPLAAGAFFPAMRAQMPPIVAGLAMVASSLSVLVSSLLLRCYRRPRHRRH